MIRASELRATWRKSSRSQNGSANCVEVGTAPDSRGVRDSKNPAGPALVFGSVPFGAFLDGVRDH